MPRCMNRFISSPFFLLCILLCLSLRGNSQSAAPASALPRLVEKDGRYALFVDGAPYLMLAAQVNNSSAWPAMLPKVWPAAAYLHLNTIEMPIYWEQWEPERGHFDPTVLHALLAGAREHHLHLVLLWFGTWKNGSGHYTPKFIKLDEAQAPHVTNANGRKVDSLSPQSQYGLDADKQAFAALMHELKMADPQHTVLMVQVENESGSYGADRDHSPAADRLFAENVPSVVLQAMHVSTTGSWPQVFGDNAAEYFHAYSIAHYISQVAAAGKAQYPLPMYVNVALRDPFHPGKPGSYDTGGPTDNVLPIWKAAAPAIDLIGPDIYMPSYANYQKELDLYHRPDNAMFVPETGNAPEYARYFFTALGHQAIGFSPFGMDQTGYVNAPLGAPKITEKRWSRSPSSTGFLHPWIG